MWAVGRPLGPRRVLHFEWKLRPQPLHVRRTPPELTPTCPPHAQPHVMPAAAYRVSNRSDSTDLNVAFAAVSWWPFGRKSRSASSARDACSEPPSTTAAAAGITWGCACGGHVGVNSGGVRLTCNGCGLSFHSKCERLDYDRDELEEMEARGQFVCGGCELSLIHI